MYTNSGLQWNTAEQTSANSLWPQSLPYIPSILNRKFANLCFRDWKRFGINIDPSKKHQKHKVVWEKKQNFKWL